MLLRTFWQDLSFGVRLLRSHPTFTSLAILTLSLGIAANTTVFSWVDGLLVHPFGGASASQELAVLEMTSASAPNGAIQVSYLDYRDYRANLQSISGLALHREDVFRLGEIPTTQAVWGELVSGNYFGVLGLKPALGRTFTADEGGDELGAHPVAVISNRLWRSRYHSDPHAIGQTLRVNRRELVVIGIAPPEFHGTMPGLAYDIWIPATMGPALTILDEGAFKNRGYRCFYALARLRPGVSTEQARVEASLFANSLELTAPKTNRGVSATVLPVWRFHSAAPDLLLGPLRILMAISILVLLIVCANVGNLLLARSIGRRKEWGIRLALGAGRGRIAVQMFTESLLLSGAGALFGLLLANWAGDALSMLVPKISAPVLVGFQMNPRVIAFTLLTCVFATLLSTSAPVFVSFRSGVNEVLKEGGRGGSQGRLSSRIREFLVITEVAMATLALVGAGLFLRSIQTARAIDPGFDRSNMLLIRYYAAGTGTTTLELYQFCARLRDRLRSTAGIRDAAYADFAPLGSSGGPYTGMEVEGYLPTIGESMETNRAFIAPGYLGALRIPLVAGRDFTESDGRGAPLVVIVNRAFEDRYFHGSSALGHKVRFWGSWRTVVGVAQNSKYFNISEAPHPYYYAPFDQEAGTDAQIFFFIKTAGDPSAISGSLRRQVAELDPNAGALDVMTLKEWTEVTLLPQIAASSLLAVLGGLSVILAAIGLYSVMAYAVSQRTQEIGIRIALGARPNDVLRAILRRGITLTAIGLTAGIAISLAATRLVASQLVDVGAADLRAFAGAAVFLTLVSLLASYVPARRATRIDPVTALHSE